MTAASERETPVLRVEPVQEDPAPPLTTLWRVLRHTPPPLPRLHHRPEARSVETFLSAVDDRRAVARGEVADRLVAMQRELGAGEAAARLARSLSHPDVHLVCTGQQPGFFGGPLLTLYKAVTAVALAKMLEATLPGRRFVPAFWIAVDDHDLDEVNQHHVLNEHFDLQRRRADLRAGRTPLGAVRVGREILEFAEAVRGSLPATEYRDAIWEETSPREGELLSRWFVRCMRRTLAGEPLVFVDPDRLRDRFAPVLSRALDRSRELRTALAAGARRLEAHGHEPAVPFDVDTSNAFLVVEGQRSRLRHVEDGFRDELRGGKHTRDELHALLDRDPGAVSPDVALRPLLQDAVLPVACVVAGPNEALYLSQLREARELLGVPDPPLWPRLGATVVEPRFLEAMRSRGVSFADLFLAEAAFRPRVEPALPGALRQTFDRLRGDAAGTVDSLREMAASIDPTLGKAFEAYERRLLSGADDLESRVQAAFARREGVERRQWRRLRGWLAPGGNLQERVFGPTTFLARYGPDLFQGLASRLDPNDFRHQLLLPG